MQGEDLCGWLLYFEPVYPDSTFHITDLLIPRVTDNFILGVWPDRTRILHQCRVLRSLFSATRCKMLTLIFMIVKMLE
jgi:hypothetical protein